MKKKPRKKSKLDECIERRGLKRSRKAFGLFGSSAAALARVRANREADRRSA